MAEISGIVYIIIGAFFAVSSKIIDTSKQENKLMFFVFIGIVMILTGIYKLIKKSVKGSPKAKVQRQSARGQCHRCGTPLHSFQEFCHKCGLKIHR